MQSVKFNFIWKCSTYLHLFIISENHPTLTSWFQKIIKFWFDKGVAAGRLDAAHIYMEDSLLRDEDYSANLRFPPFDWPDTYYKYTHNQWESYQFIHKLRKFVDSHYNSNNEDEK